MILKLLCVCVKNVSFVPFAFSHTHTSVCLSRLAALTMSVFRLCRRSSLPAACGQLTILYPPQATGWPAAAEPAASRGSTGSELPAPPSHSSSLSEPCSNTPQPPPPPHRGRKDGGPKTARPGRCPSAGPMHQLGLPPPVCRLTAGPRAASICACNPGPWNTFPAPLQPCRLSREADLPTSREAIGRRQAQCCPAPREGRDRKRCAPLGLRSGCRRFVFVG